MSKCYPQIETVKQTLAKRIKMFRENRKLTQGELGNACAITCRTISNVEHAKVAPALDVLLALADFFQLGLDELLGRTVPGQKPRRNAEQLINDKIHMADDRTLKHLSAYMDLLEHYV